MSDINAEDLANLAREFTKTTFGKWYVEELKGRIERHHSLAEGTDAHNLTVNSTMRAAGLSEALKVLTDNVALAESPIFKK
jgi:hypothetical protein